MKLDLISYKGFFPKIEKDVVRSSTSTAIGNTVLGSKCILKDRVVLRGDGAEIIVGNEVTFFCERRFVVKIEVGTKNFDELPLINLKNNRI